MVVNRLGAYFLHPERFPEPARGCDLDAYPSGYLQQVPVTRHEHVGFARHCFLKHGDVIRITQLYRQRDAPADHRALLTKEPLGGIDGGARHSHLVAEHPAKLAEHRFTKHQIVFRYCDPQHISAESARRQGADQDIRVEENPQEMSRKTSSSVR